MEVMEILQWAIPSGGIGTAFGWLINRRLSAVRIKKEIHDTYKTMYEDVSVLVLNVQKKYEECIETINELREEKNRTNRALNRLSRAIEAIPLCDYHGQCPVLAELRIDEDSSTCGPGETVTHGAIDGGKCTSGRQSGRACPGDGRTHAADNGARGITGGSRIQPRQRKHPCGGPS